MVHIERVDFANKRQIKRFVELPHRLYRDCPQWVPPLNSDAYAQLNPRKHPFYEHSDVECFLAMHNGRDVGRIAALEKPAIQSIPRCQRSQLLLFRLRT
jgi:hypothetical protein